MRVMPICLGLLAAATLLPKAAADQPDGLNIIVLPTIQYAHGDIWAKTPNGRGPVSTAVSRVVRGQPVHILVFATRFSTDPGHIAEVDYRLSFVRPDGSAEFAKDGLRLIARAPVKEPRNVHKAVELAVFVATMEDPLGTWRVVVEATDRVGHTTVRREQPLTVAGDEVLTEPLPPGSDKGRWLMGYHFKPLPQQLFAAVKDMAENPPAGAKPRRDAENGAWLGFFEQVITDNPWLLPHAITRLENAEGRERELLATLLAYSKRDDRAFLTQLPEASRLVIKERQNEAWPVPTKEPLQGAQLDVLWGRFFASGRYEPIRELVALLAYHPYKDALDEYKKLEKKPAKPPVELYKSAVFRSAAWSLQSNIQQDKVVRDYCEGIILRKELPEAEHGWLAGLFRAAVENSKKRKPPDQATPGKE
jgi:hypothetical protein